MSDTMNTEAAESGAVELPVTVSLSEPVSAGGKTYEAIVFARKRKVADLVASDAVKGQLRKEAAVYASMAGVPLPVILDLTADDFELLQQKVAPLLGKSWEAVTMGWMTSEALLQSVASGVSAEMDRRKQASA